MKKILGMAVLVTSAVGALTPSQAVVVNLGTFSPPPTQIAVPFALQNVTGPFTDYFNFTLNGNMIMTSSGLQSTSLALNGATFSNLDFTSVALYNGLVTSSSGTGLGTLVGNYTLSPADAAGQENASLSARTLTSGNYVIRVQGNTTAAPALYNGNITFAASAVPEPATWGLMLLGFGLVGTSLRSRRRSVVVAA